MFGVSLAAAATGFEGVKVRTTCISGEGDGPRCASAALNTAAGVGAIPLDERLGCGAIDAFARPRQVREADSNRDGDR